MAQSRLRKRSLISLSWRGLLACSIALGTLAPTAASGQQLPPICRRRGVADAIRTLIRFCPSGNCIPRAGIGDLLEQRVDPNVLQQIASDAALVPARIFYKTGRGRFDATDTVSAEHFAHAHEDLREVARTYARFPHSKVIVLGRASRSGDLTSNIHLSQERARRVADYLNHEFHIAYDDIHQAYFGSHLFQMQASDLPSLGIAADDLPRGADGQTDVTLAANQSTVAFVFPCPETAEEQQAVRAEEQSHEGEGCPLDEDGGVKSPAARPSDNAACRSIFASADAGVPNRVYLMGGRLSQLFAEYTTALGRREGGRDLRTLVVFYPESGADGGVVWRSKSSPVTWFTSNPINKWQHELGDAQVPVVATVPSHSGAADVFCGQNPPSPLPQGAAMCACRTPGSPEQGDSGALLVAVAVGMLGFARRKRSRSE